MNALHRPIRAKGFSLIEVMVAVIVICVGLLGIAKMQAMALSSSTTSRLRSLAAIQAASLASAMHANRRYWAQATGTLMTITANKRTITSSDAALQAAAVADLAALPTVPCLGSLGGGPVCANPSVNLAAADVAVWTDAIARLLPNPISTITCTFTTGVTVPSSCTILIQWSENAVAMNTQQSNASLALAPPDYTLYVEP